MQNANNKNNDTKLSKLEEAFFFIKCLLYRLQIRGETSLFAQKWYKESTFEKDFETKYDLLSSTSFEIDKPLRHEDPGKSFYCEVGNKFSEVFSSFDEAVQKMIKDTLGVDLRKIEDNSTEYEKFKAFEENVDNTDNTIKELMRPTKNIPQCLPYYLVNINNAVKTQLEEYCEKIDTLYNKIEKLVKLKEQFVKDDILSSDVQSKAEIAEAIKEKFSTVNSIAVNDFKKEIKECAEKIFRLQSLPDKLTKAKDIQECFIELIAHIIDALFLKDKDTKKNLIKSFRDKVVSKSHEEERGK